MTINYPYRLCPPALGDGFSSAAAALRRFRHLRPFRPPRGPPLTSFRSPLPPRGRVRPVLPFRPLPVRHFRSLLFGVVPVPGDTSGFSIPLRRRFRSFPSRPSLPVLCFFFACFFTSGSSPLSRAQLDGTSGEGGFGIALPVLRFRPSLRVLRSFFFASAFSVPLFDFRRERY